MPNVSPTITAMPLPLSPAASPLPPSPTTPQLFVDSAVTLEVPINYKIYDPNIDRRLSTAKKITLGDLHGNTMTLFIILLKCGALIPKVRAAANDIFDQISQIVVNATDTPLNSEDYRNFVSLINRFDVNPHAPSIRLLGDVLAERLSNDVLALKLLHKLILANPSKITIVYSNHDNELFIFLAACGMTPIPYTIPSEDFIGSHKRWRYFMSYIWPNPYNRVIIEDMLESVRAYIGVLKMFDYEYPIRPASGIPPDRDFCLYTHASFDWSKFKPFIQLLCGQQQLSDTLGITHFIVLIEQANVRLRMILENLFADYKVMLNTQQIKTAQDYDTSEFAQIFGGLGKPGWEFIWHRYQATYDPFTPTPFPNFFNVHGHDQASPYPGKTYDQSTGKTLYYLESYARFMLELEVIS